MRAISDQRGFTLIELLIASAISLIVLTAAGGAITAFMDSNASQDRRNQDEASARIATDRLAFQLRNVAAPGVTASGVLEQAGPYSIVFQTIDTSQGGGLNVTDAKRVRYCLDNSVPSSETLWQQVQSWTTATAPTIPSTTGCPDGAWGNQTALVQNITNENNGHNRPLFTYGPGASPTLAQISSVQADIFLAQSPGKTPAETELTTGIALRNGNEPPTAAFTATPVNGQLLLNASTSTDPNGQALTYQWSLDSSPISGATAQQYTLPLASQSTHTVTLTISDSGGLTGQTTKTVVMP